MLVLRDGVAPVHLESVWSLSRGAPRKQSQRSARVCHHACQC